MKNSAKQKLNQLWVPLFLSLGLALMLWGFVVTPEDLQPQGEIVNYTWDHRGQDQIEIRHSAPTRSENSHSGRAPQSLPSAT